MRSVVCTLFEKNYHYGVAALTNSLYRKGFRGSIYVGYRGALPAWCSNSKENTAFQWPDSTVFNVADDCQIYFLPLTTDYHLTNYKPDFMLSLLNGPASDAEAIYYFDPDIVLTAVWSNFKTWTDCGIALCEDINSPVYRNHPRRVAWRNYFGQKNVVLTFKEPVYANGGFIGLDKKYFDFLEVWRTLQELMAPSIGGLNQSVLKSQGQPEAFKGRFAPFVKTDQDVLNATVEAWDGPVSYVGKSAMGFDSGVTIVPHAVGGLKPWNVNYFKRILIGRSPRYVDKLYWQFANRPIKLYPAPYILWKRFIIIFISFIGRFYSRA
jgi:hypothetical protein